MLQIKNFILTRLLVNHLLVNIVFTKIWVHLTFFFFLGAPVQTVSLEPRLTILECTFPEENVIGACSGKTWRWADTTVFCAIARDNHHVCMMFWS